MKLFWALIKKVRCQEIFYFKIVKILLNVLVFGKHLSAFVNSLNDTGYKNTSISAFSW